MSVQSESSGSATEAPTQQGSRIAMIAYAVTVLLSAFLLFQVQPLLSKFILPWFGGSPAVWTAAMLFFQLVLFLGYLYAHLVSTRLSPRHGWLVHLTLLTVAVASVAITRLAPDSRLRPTGQADESPLFQVLLLLGATVGVPYFTLSSTGPLLQKWFSEVFVGVSPYRLFALSNFGSLVALLSYPFYFEANWGIHSQAAMWSIGFVCFACCCAVCACHHFLSTRSLDRPLRLGAAAETDAPPPGWGMVFSWVALPTLASVMFLAVTNEVCQNVATVPLLWIVPLALYLMSFILAFDHPEWCSRPFFAAATVLFVTWSATFTISTTKLSKLLDAILGYAADNELALDDRWWLRSIIYFAGLFAVTVLCHGELARRRPAPKHLTSFYLTLSFGGALGGICINLIAPYIFDTFFEFPIAMVCSMLLATALLATGPAAMPKIRDRLAGLIGLALTLVVGWQIFDEYRIESNATYRVMHQDRNFYGIVEVQQRAVNDPEGQENMTFFSGHVTHGKQMTAANERRTPLTYYGEGSGCQRALQEVLRRRENCQIGVIGLGVGTIATYGRPGDTVRFYDINPHVIDIAQNTDWFTYLADCRGKIEVVLGDARLQLEHEARAGNLPPFDILVLDAFTGDSIPTHLLTTQAFDVYRQRLKADGVLVVHITNTYLDIYPVVKRLAEEHGFDHRRIYRTSDFKRLLFRNYYAILSKNQDLLATIDDEIADLPEYLRRPREIPLWTDDYTNLTRLLR